MKKIIALTCVAVGGCSVSAQDTLAPQTPLGCHSIHPGDEMRFQQAPRLKLPLAKFREPGKGRSVALLPSSGNTLRTYWTSNPDSTGKQTVLKVETGQIDFSPMHRLIYQKGQEKTVQVVSIPVKHLEVGIEIQPVLEPSEAQWGSVKPYPLRLSASGFAHPFQNLPRIFDQIEPGSIYIPKPYQNNITVIPPVMADVTACPVGGGNGS